MNDVTSTALDFDDFAKNFDDLLEALSTLRLINDLPAYKLTETTLLKNALKILYQGCKTTSCTIYVWPKNSKPKYTTPADLQDILAIDANGIVHRRAATPVENHFISKTISEQRSQRCDDCHTLANEHPCGKLEMSIISVPIYDIDTLTGVITINHSVRDHVNQWWHQLMETFSKTLGHLLTICRIQD